MCIFHKWKPHWKIVPRHWVQFKVRVFPPLFSGPPYLQPVPGVGWWSTKKLDSYRCTKCGKIDSVKS